jgi:hypothetical protein
LGAGEALQIDKDEKGEEAQGQPAAPGPAKELKRVCGVDLTSIDGIDVMTALTISSEIGTM